MPATIMTLDDISEIETIPISERDLPVSTYEVIFRTAQRYPERPALVFFNQPANFLEKTVINYREFIAEITRAANMFHRFGITTGKSISYLLPLLPQTHFVLWGAQAAGIANPINPMLGTEHIAEIIKATGSEIVVTLSPETDDGEIWRKTVEAVSRLDQVKTVFLVRGYDETMPPLSILQAELPDHITLYDFADCRRKENPDSLNSARKFKAEDIASYFHTGGTTGTPKIASHSHGNEIFDGWEVGFILGLPPESTLLCGLPMFHVNAAIITGVAPFFRGQTVVLAGPYGFRNPELIENFWQIIAHYNIAFFSAVPTLIGALVSRPITADISSLQYVICGAAPLPLEVFRAFEEKVGATILEGYGMTEGTCVNTMNPRDGERKTGSVGWRLPYQKVKPVCLNENGQFVRFCDVDEVGVVVMWGPAVFSGYLQEEHNKKAWVDINGQQWLNTGDIGREDAESYLWLTGRKSETIIRGGHNIDPKVIEEALHKHPAVQFSAAIGRLDAYAGELPVAYVQLKKGQSVSREALMAFSRDHISERAAIPKDIIILEALPVTAVGKLFKPALRERDAVDVCKNLLQENIDMKAPQITAHTDSKRGLVVSVKLDVPDAKRAALIASVQKLLGQFALHYDVV